MANIVTNNNQWTGKFVEGLNQRVQLGADSIKAGLFRVVEAIRDKAIVKLYDTDSALVVGDFCNTTPTGGATITDIVIPVTTFSIKKELCKQSLINSNLQLSMNNWGAAYTTIPDEVIAVEIEAVLNKTKIDLERIRWSGDTASADTVLLKADGLVKKIKAKGTVAGVGYIPVVGASVASKDPATVIAEINKVIAATPAIVAMNPGFKLIVSPEVASAYRQAMAASGGLTLATWGMGLPEGIERVGQFGFVGYFANSLVPMYMAYGLIGANSEVILSGVFANDETGNLVLGTDALSDMNSLYVKDRQDSNILQPFIDVLFAARQGYDVLRPYELVMYHV